MWGYKEPMNVKMWLQQKGAGRQAAPSTDPEQDALNGLLIALKGDIGNQTLSQDIEDE